MVIVSVYTHGGNVFQGEMKEHETTDLIALWSAKRWTQPVLPLSMKGENSVEMSYVRYDEIAGITYVLGL